MDTPIGRPPNEIDWPMFLRIVSFHRIEGLAWNALSSTDFPIPSDIRARMSSAARLIAGDSLRSVAECTVLQRSFASAGVPLLFLKGPTLGSLAYRKQVLKASIDIDLLIDPRDLTAAGSILGEHGYKLIVPANEKALQTWHRRSKESVWVRDETGFQVDLHTRVADNPLLVPGISVHSPAQAVEVGTDRPLRTLATDELFTYLAVHGGTSSWFRLKWISDFAGFLHSKEPPEIDRLYRRSQELGAARAAGQGLLLADRLFTTLAGNAELRVQLQGERATRFLVDRGLALLSRTPREPTERLLGTLPLHLAPLLLMPGWRYKMSELAGQAGRLINRA